MWNPVKELKGPHRPRRPPRLLRLWNPVKELKESVSRGYKRGDTAKWNPVKELKDATSLAASGLEYIKVESGEGIESHPAALATSAH